MSARSLDEVAAGLCRSFLGWRLREDYEALLAIGEGRLRIDLRSGEAWCDGDPIPPLFIAAALRGELEEALARHGVAFETLRAAELDAEFAAGSVWTRGQERPHLQLACRARLATDHAEGSAEAANTAA